MLFRCFTMMILWLSFTIAATAAPTDLARLHVDSTPVNNVQELILHCDLIVSGHTGRQLQSAPTGGSVRQGKLVNFVQSFYVQRTWKGTSPSPIKLLSTGVEPLPDARDPINSVYPGPLGDGDYLLFLKKVKGTDFYSVIGVWQGVYPVQAGRTIALRGAGFAELNGLSLDQITAKLRSLQPTR